VLQLNWEVGWQDLKDLFRQAGDIVRADIHTGPDGNPKGSGSVTFTNAQDASNAIGAVVRCRCVALIRAQSCSTAPS
jgi:RNA recognition motif-containing protein